MNFNDMLDEINHLVETSTLNNADRICQEIEEKMRELTIKYGKVGKKERNLLEGYRVTYESLGNGVIKFTLINDAVAEGMGNYNGKAKYYWNIVNEGRKATSEFRGTRPNDPFRRGLEKWAKSVGFTGNTFFLARKINNEGFKGTPKLFDEIITDAQTIIDNNH